MRYESPVYRQRDAKHEARTWAAQPKHRCRNFLCPAHPANGLIAQEFLYGIGIDPVAHWRIDTAWANEFSIRPDVWCRSVRKINETISVFPEATDR